MTKNRTQRQLPGGEPPIVTYSRRRAEELPEVYDDGRAEPRFDDEPVAEWDAVEVPPEPPLHGRRRPRPLVQDVRTPLDEDDLGVPPAPAAAKEKPKRSTVTRLVAVVAVAAVVIGIGVLVYAFTSSTTVTVAPGLGAATDEAGTVPADDVANAGPAVREIPLTGEGGTVPAPPPSASSPASESTAPAAPPVPRARPEPPASAATAVAPDFDQATPNFDHAAPAPVQTAPAVPQTASAPANGGADDDFIARIEQTLAKTGESSAPALSPSAQPIQLTPQAADPAIPIPPENIPMTDGQGQPVQLPQDFLIDTE